MALGRDQIEQFHRTGFVALKGFIGRDDIARVSAWLDDMQQRRLMTPEWQPLTEEDPPYSPAGEYALIEADPGDVIFFDSYVPHGSPANTSDRSRRNVYVTFNRRSAGDMRDRYYAEKWTSYPPNNLTDARESSSYRV